MNLEMKMRSHPSAAHGARPGLPLLGVAHVTDGSELHHVLPASNYVARLMRVQCRSAVSVGHKNRVAVASQLTVWINSLHSARIDCANERALGSVDIDTVMELMPVRTPARGLTRNESRPWPAPEGTTHMAVLNDGIQVHRAPLLRRGFHSWELYNVKAEVEAVLFINEIFGLIAVDRQRLIRKQN